MNNTDSRNLFAIARERGWDWREVLDFSSNVNPLGYPAGARDAIVGALDRITHYPETDSPALVEGLAKYWNVPGAGMLLGNGSTELLHFFGRAAWPGPVTLLTPASHGHLSAFPKAMKVPVNEPDRWPQRGLLVLTHPNQPTGEPLPEPLLRRAVAMREGPVLIDESYIDFTNLESTSRWCESHPNLLVLRSLTAFYGLPGLRVGALIAGDEWMKRLRPRREPWQVGVLAEAAALAAIQDSDFANRSRELVEAERTWLFEQVQEWRGAEFTESVTNYLFARIQQPATEVQDWFLNRKILIRNYTGLPGVEGQAVGFAVRTRAENQRLAEAGKERFCDG
ncbi:MAG: aminotransferase class I/II-fold pyridoxal phosphate-dependent enzyme [Bryobacterales bacterium]|nr:aminotransferase class I/II-fold pyridoxal phosphate-dependent enzyme [Bryobacterales bacterium]